MFGVVKVWIIGVRIIQVFPWEFVRKFWGDQGILFELVKNQIIRIRIRESWLYLRFIFISDKGSSHSHKKLWCDPFVQSRKCMALKFTEELCVMTMKNNAKFEEEMTFHFKTDMRNLTNFDSSTRKSKKKCCLIGSFDQSI